MKKELVSVIVPVYKVEKYLNRCVNSVVNQSYENIEIILVDDGSPDKCPEICEEWARKDCRVKVIHKINGGLSDARNKGLELAKGCYVCFVDSDDYVAKTYVETLYGLICSKKTDISAVSLKEVFSLEPEISKNATGEGIITVFEGKEALKQLFYNDTFANYAWNKMYKRNLFENVKFPVGRKMEDLGTTYKLLLRAERIAYSTEVLYYYFQREDSILHKVNLDFYRDKFELSRERYEKIQDIYPDLKENDLFYFGVLLEAYPKLFSIMNGYDWTNAANRTFENCKKMVNTKDRIKYYLLVRCGWLFRIIGKNK